MNYEPKDQRNINRAFEVVLFCLFVCVTALIIILIYKEAYNMKRQLILDNNISNQYREVRGNYAE